MSQTPARAQQPQNGGLHPQVREFMQSASDIYHDHDALIDENTSLRNRAEVAEGLNDHYKSDLKEITADRDYHMRLALALTTRLNAAMDMLSGILSVSQHEAQNPGPKRFPGETKQQILVEGEAAGDVGR